MSTVKIVSDPNYSNLSGFLEKLVSPNWFASNGKTIHSGRNVIKQFDVDGLHLP